jgi:hypothetical protein
MPGKEAVIANMETHFETAEQIAGHATATTDCLDGWKGIAEYLRRDVRTVQRWEKSLGLPIERVQDSKSGSVCAYKSKIDAWRCERSIKVACDRLPAIPALPWERQPAPVQPVRRTRLWALISLLVGLAMGAAFSQFISYSRHGSASAHSSSTSSYAYTQETKPNSGALGPDSSGRED